jgi:hypothetical protein
LSGATEFEPKSFEQAWNHNDKKYREKCIMLIKKVSNDMDTKKVIETIKKEDIPKGRRPIKDKWIFNIKRV